MLGGMARDEDDESPWTRQLLFAAGALVAVALVIGGVVSVVALGAANVAGIDEARPTATAAPSLYIPSGEPTTTPDGYPDPEGGEEADPTEDAAPSATATTKRKARAISLQAFPAKVSANERINLSGVYQRGEGAQLQVQRREGGTWTDFPVTTSVSGGLFDTYVYTGRSGTQRFRVTDLGSGRSSNPVRVTVG